MEKRAKIFFPNLNGVRAIAAFLVVVSHIELTKKDFHYPMAQYFHILGMGSIGVSIFFSLSGFLITYLLLEEKKYFNKVDFKDFYVRRILRIWPLYYLVIIVGFFIYPGIVSAKPLLLSVFFLPNIAFTLALLPAIFDPIWSVGIEEQFYIFHPHFFRIKKNQHILYALILFIVLFFAAFAAIKHLHSSNIALNQFFYFARYDDMMIGAIVAVIYFNTKNKTFDFIFQKAFDFLFNKYMQVLLLIVFVAFIILSLHVNIPQGDILLALLSGLLIVNLCETSTSVFSLDYKPLQFIGRISYGIYLLHKFPLLLVVYLVNKYMGAQSLLLQNIVIYIATFAAAVSVAAISYYGYERYFLQLKKRFQKIANNSV
jgi:peptidoglycan/LPS O-acetylase OafA/YrhL